MDKKVVRIAYVPPQAEVCAADSYNLLTGTFFGHDPGGASLGDDGGGSAGQADLITDAKQAPADFIPDAKVVILGREFSLSDPWE